MADLKLAAVENKAVANLLKAARAQLDRIDVDPSRGDATVARMGFVLEFLYEAVLELAPKTD
jgi:hypothetical protein